jgi:hypothetical protein
MSEAKRGQTIKVFYDSNDPSDMSLDQVKPKYIGMILVCIGCCLPLFAALQYYLVQHYKIAAAATGTSNAFGLVRDVGSMF